MAKIQQEIWKNIIGYEGVYQISNTGEVKNIAPSKLKTIRHISRAKKDRIIKGFLLSGYRAFRIGINYNHKTKYIHRLLAEAFIPNPNNHPQVNHIDGNKLNNSLYNLEWVTVKENIHHVYRTGLKANYTGIGRATLTKELQTEILSLHGKGLTHSEIGGIYNTDPSQISRIVNHKILPL